MIASAPRLFGSAARSVRIGAFVCLLLYSGRATLAAQIPTTFENLQYFPKDVPRDTLVRTMIGFSFALGVRCQYCHAGGDGISFVGVRFASDEKPAKRNARYMLHMTDTINARLLAGLPARNEPPVLVQCVTCHRRLAKPATLESTLTATLETNGVDSVRTRYRHLRQTTMTYGMFDFDERTLSGMARSLGERGKTAEAIQMLELNQEFYPSSWQIDLAIGDLHRQRGESENAIARFRLVLQKDSTNQAARQRLRALGVP